MIPVTYPSSVSTSKESQMVVYALPSVTGLRRWTDYIPVKLQATGADIANSFNTNGYLACDFLQTTTGRQAWIDYIPVFVDNAATVPWQVSDTGFIPFNTLPGGGLYYLGPTLDLNFVSSLSNPLFSATAEDYTLNTNFLSLFYQVEAQYSVLGTNGVEQKNFADIVTFTRASTATYFNSAGTLTTATTNEARFDHNPSTLAPLGFLIEEQRTNSIRNNTMQGAVAGTPGTNPTNWLIPNPSNGLSRQIVGTGTENGITYVDVRYSGTTSAASLTAIYWEAATQVAAASGQTWTNSVYVALVGGSTANTTGVVVGIDENNGAGGFLTGSSTTFVPSAGALSGKRVSHTRTLTNASTAFVWPYVFFSYGNGAAIDITLRIGLPQLEQGAFATSVIPTTTTALTRSADVASVNTLSPWFNATEGTLFAEFNCPTAATNQYFASLDLSALTRMSLHNNAGSGYWFVRDGGVTQAGVTNGTITSGATVKVAGAYAIDSFNLSTNGGIGTEDTSGRVPSGLTRLSLGSYTASALNPLNGHIRRITYYPRRLSNADLQTITA